MEYGIFFRKHESLPEGGPVEHQAGFIKVGYEEEPDAYPSQFMEQVYPSLQPCIPGLKLIAQLSLYFIQHLALEGHVA